MKFIKQLIPFATKRRIKDHLGVPSLHWSLLNLKRLGYSPKMVLDIGAYHGEWTIDFLEVFPAAQVVMFEAQEEKESTLKELANRHSNVDYFISLLSASDGQKLFFYANETASHVTPESNTGTSSKITRTIDSVLKERNLPFPDFMKLDVQGFELEVLKGAKDSLAQTEFCLLEVSCMQLGNEPVVLEVMAFMDLQGFQLYDVCKLMRRPFDKALYQMDFLFVRKDSRFVAAKRWN